MSHFWSLTSAGLMTIVTSDQRTRVVYLLGAGATFGATAASGSDVRLLMPDLRNELHIEMGKRFREAPRYSDDAQLRHIVNSSVIAETDFEQLITFLAD